MKSQLRLRLITGCMLILFVGTIVAADADGYISKWTLPVPVPFAYPLPDWLEVPVQEYGEGTTTLSVPVIPVPAAAELVVTVYFNESLSNLIRVIWDDGDSAVMLTSNLVAGVGGPHKKSLLLDHRLTQSPGVLYVIAQGSTPPVYQLEFEWVVPREVNTMDSGSSPEYFLSDGRRLEFTELYGVPYQPLADRWNKDIISAPLTNRIERLDQGLVFVAPLEEVPNQARAAVWITGLPVTGEMRLQINNKDAGPVAFMVPDLADHGYYQDEAGTWYYAGWRKGEIAFDEELLVVGDNYFELVEADSESLVPLRAIAIKDLMVQLRYNSPAEPPESTDQTSEGVEVRRAQAHIEFLIGEPTLMPLD